MIQSIFVRLCVLIPLLSGLTACGGESERAGQSAGSPSLSDVSPTPTATTLSPTSISVSTAIVPAPTNAASPSSESTIVAPPPTTLLATSGNAEIYIINIDNSG